MKYKNLLKSSLEDLFQFDLHNNEADEMESLYLPEFL